MKTLSRRDLLKSGLLAPAAVAAMAWDQWAPRSRLPELSLTRSLRAPRPNRGQAPAANVSCWISAGASTSAMPMIRPRTFGFGRGRSGNFRRQEIFFPPAPSRSTIATGRPSTCPTTGRSSCRSKTIQRLPTKGFYPLGRTYPATSVGWYRRVFELSAADAGKRITIEFDGSYRETMVVFNGFYIGRHSGGYDPFSFDVTDFATPGGKNVLLVRVDATSSDGWFYEGAGIYRHVWLVKTNPVHVKQWGTFVTSEVRPGEAALSIRTEVENQGTGCAESARHLHDSRSLWQGGGESSHGPGVDSGRRRANL